MANTQDKRRPSAAQAPLKRGKNKLKEDGKQAPAPTNGKPLNKSAESPEIAGGKSAKPLRARKYVAISGITADVPPHGECLPPSNERTLPAGIARAAGTFASEPRDPSNKSAESSESAGAIVECPAPKRSVHKKYVSIGGQASIRQFDRCYTNSQMRMLYVLAIIMILDGHIGSSDYLDLNGLLRYQNYHIALFMFVSGYFLNLARGYGEFFKTKVMRLLVPLYAWNAVYGGVCWYLNRYQGFALGGEWNWYNLLYAPLVDGHQFIYNMASWFLVPLFLVQAAGFMILKPFAGTDGAAAEEENTRQNKWAPVLFFGLALGLGCAALAYAPENRGERGITLTALRGLYFLPAFAFGYLYRRTLEKYDRLATPLWLGLLLGGVTLLTGAFPGYNHVPSWLDTINAPGLAIYAISFLAILFWVRVARVLTPVWEKSRTLKYISEHTFDLMMHHFVGFMLAKALFLPFAPGDGAANLARVKSDIWYYPFPGGDENYAWIYIAISMVIALLAGFTSRKIYGIIRRN